MNQQQALTLFGCTLVVCSTVAVGLIVTKSAWCIAGLIIPGFHLCQMVDQAGKEKK